MKLILIPKTILFKILRYNKRIAAFILIAAFTAILFLVLMNSGLIKAKGSDDCLVCHDDKDLTMEKNGKKISLYINGKVYGKSIHGSFDCKDCHEGYNPEAMPHNPSKKEINCLSCHDNVKSSADNVHKNQKCSACHNPHDTKPVKKSSAKDQTKINSENCLGCHKNKNVQSYLKSAHSKKNVGCEGCHKGGHEVKKINKNDATQICGRCHGNHQKEFNNSIHQTVLKEGNAKAPNCVDCHGSHNIIGSKFSIESQSCLKCHLDEKLFPGEERGSAKFVSQYKTSIHSSIMKDGNPAAGCSDCHGNHTIEGGEVLRDKRKRITEACNKCHPGVMDKYKHSAHGTEMLKNNPKAPMCMDCHGEHDIKATLSSDEFSKINQVEMCLKCHQDQKLPHKNYKGEEVLISNYKDSYHYRALKEGKTNAATCSDCHGSHEMKKYDDPASKISKQNIQQTCGQSNCHIKQLSEYVGSVHETAIREKNNYDSPNCTNCHGNHQIMKNNETGSQLSSSKGLVQLCSGCHNSVELVRKYNLPTGRTNSYNDSFHGLAVRGGSKTAANCESCHGYHNVRNSKDSTSSINKKNLPQTCGKCHPGANDAFLNTAIHVTDFKNESPWVFWTTRFYMIMIIMTIGGMILHNILDLRKKVQEKNAKKNH